MKVRSYKREFLDKVKQKFNDLQPSNKDNKSNPREPRYDKERKGGDTKGVAFRG